MKQNVEYFPLAVLPNPFLLTSIGLSAKFRVNLISMLRRF